MKTVFHRRIGSSRSEERRRTREVPELRRAKALLGLSCLRDALTGAVCVVQRTDGVLRLNVHLHVLALDGVYTEEASGRLTFHALPTPTAAEVWEIAQRTALRLHRAFKKEGRTSPWDEEGGREDACTESVQAEQPGLFACYEAAAAGEGVSGERAGKPPLRLKVSPSAIISSSLKLESIWLINEDAWPFRPRIVRRFNWLL